jgi:hypothetical protein
MLSGDKMVQAEKWAFASPSIWKAADLLSGQWHHHFKVPGEQSRSARGLKLVEGIGFQTKLSIKVLGYI